VLVWRSPRAGETASRAPEAEDVGMKPVYSVGIEIVCPYSSPFASATCGQLSKAYVRLTILPSADLLCFQLIPHVEVRFISSPEGQNLGAMIGNFCVYP
jgi:hypothetical protein